MSSSASSRSRAAAVCLPRSSSTKSISFGLIVVTMRFKGLAAGSTALGTPFGAGAGAREAVALLLETAGRVPLRTVAEVGLAADAVRDMLLVDDRAGRVPGTVAMERCKPVDRTEN